jgi:hypothetical protein
MQLEYRYNKDAKMKEIRDMRAKMRTEAHAPTAADFQRIKEERDSELRVGCTAVLNPVYP